MSGLSLPISNEFNIFGVLAYRMILSGKLTHIQGNLTKPVLPLGTIPVEYYRQDMFTGEKNNEESTYNRSHWSRWGISC
jgi:hypothetical protein